MNRWGEKKELTRGKEKKEEVSGKCLGEGEGR